MFSESKPGVPGSGFWNVGLKVEFFFSPSTSIQNSPETRRLSRQMQPDRLEQVSEQGVTCFLERYHGRCDKRACEWSERAKILLAQA